MRSPHKWAKEIHAIGDGKQTQWARDYNKPIEWNDFDPVWDSSPISSSDEIIWRIKPPEVTQWRKDLAEAKKNGKIVERFWFGEWTPSPYSEDDFLNGDLEIYLSGDFRIQPGPTPIHPDDIAVDKFAIAMKEKMERQRANGYSGWENLAQCPTERLQAMLAEHIDKGDPVDVGNFAMMLFNRGERTNKPEPKPNVVQFMHWGLEEGKAFLYYRKPPNFKLIFDAESGKPISAEVLK